jgi:hypothetical protein
MHASRDNEPNAVWLAETPTLKAYVDRLGAVQKSLRRFVIEEDGPPVYGKLRRTIGTIQIDVEGNLTVRDVERPAPEEAAAIKAEVTNANWPRSIPHRRGALPPQLAGVDKTDLFEFFSPDGEEVLFIQQRVENPNDPDDKCYLPWSYWNDDKWRCMEPDGLLPLYGLHRLKNAYHIFLHEGAKAARAAQGIVDKNLPHPWLNELFGVHLGWPGGALNAQRVDWEPIRALSKHHPVTIIADHDALGECAVSTISSLLRRPLMAVRFDDRFPDSFDLADDWPDRPEWWSGKRYVGPSLDDMASPATWATEVIHQAGRGRPRYKLRDEFVAEWYMVQQPHLFAHRMQVNRLLPPEVFNRAIAPFSHADDTARLLARRFDAHADSIAYRPHRKGESGRLLTIDGQRLVNTFRPPAIGPLRGNIHPFLRFIRYLIPDQEDRSKVLRWCATLIARPEVRMRYSLLLISETQGVGKTTLGDAILAPLVGRWNVSTPSEKQVNDNGFNSWIAHRRLAIINEIYSGAQRKCYDQLKFVISDDRVEVNRKFLESYVIDNWLHIVACSNSIRALHLDDGDRRWLVPRVVEEQRSEGWWKEFYAWLNGDGLPTIAAWAEAYVVKYGAVRTGEHAPMTTAKEDVIAESRSDGQRLAFELAQAAMAQQRQIVLRVDEVRAWVARERSMEINDHRVEKLRTLRKALRDGGMIGPLTPDGRISIDGRRQGLVANFELSRDANWGALRVHHLKPEDVQF